VENIGAVPAPASTLRYYVVSTAGLGKKDLKGTPAVPPLDPLHSFTDQETVTIRTETVPGDYYLQACADSGKVVVEKHEDNNCLTSTGIIHVTSRPDLVVTSVTVGGVPLTVALGGSLRITTVVKNQGGGSAGQSNIRFFLIDTVTGISKDLKGTPSVPALASGASSTTNATVTVFTDTLPGTYTVRACADYQEVVSETDENNNCTMGAGTVTVQ
jgi:subtilase family serine protease